MKLPETWVHARLTDVCELNPRLAADERPDDDLDVTFVPMAAVDEHRGVIAKPEIRKYREVAKGYTAFSEGDVLFAKVRPCMENGKAAVARNLVNGLGFGSSKFHVLKYVVLPPVELELLKVEPTDVLIVRSNGNPDYVGRCAPITEELADRLTVYASYLIRLRTDGERLLPEYLSAFLNSGYGRAAMRNAIRTTAGQSNLSGGSLGKMRIPVPSPEDQRFFKSIWNAASHRGNDLFEGVSPFAP